MSNWLIELRDKLENFKNRSPEKFLLLIVLLIGVFFLWGYIIFFLNQENNLSARKNEGYAVSDAEKEDFNFANDDRNDKIDSKDNNKKTTEIDDNDFRNSPFEYQSNLDSSVEGVFRYQAEKTVEDSQAKKEELDLDEFSLQGIIIAENTKLAVINKKNRNDYYRNFDQLAGYAINEIDKDSVILKDKLGYEHRIQLED